MKRYRLTDGTEGIWYPANEIDQIMEAELAKAQLFPTVDAPVVNIEKFVEVHLNACVDQYAELHPSVLGVTEFRAGKPPLVQLNKDLTGSALDQDGSPVFLRGRWRATLAHEGSHILLHRCLFQLNPDQAGLFDTFGETASIPDERSQRCLKREARFGGGTDWREVQANKGMASLLMPRPVFFEVFRKELELAGWLHTPVERHSPKAHVLITKLAALFQVSQQAASIRCQTLELFNRPNQVGFL